MLDYTDVEGLKKVRTKTEEGKLFVHTTFYDDKDLEQNNRIRLSGMLDKAKLGLHENEDMRAVISCPSNLQWSLFRKKHNDTYKLLTTRGTLLQDEADRVKGVKQLEILHPDWVIYTRL